MSDEQKEIVYEFVVKRENGEYAPLYAYESRFPSKKFHKYYPLSGTEAFFGSVRQELFGKSCGFEIPSYLKMSGKVDVKFENGVDPSTVFFVVWDEEQLKFLEFPGVTVLLGQNY